MKRRLPPDAGAVLATLILGLAARLAWNVPLAVVGGVGVAWLVIRRPPLLVVALALLCSARAHGGITELSQVRLGPIVGVAQLRADPGRAPPAMVEADATLHGQRWRLRATATVGRELLRRAAGERFEVRGSIRKFSRDGMWRIARHLQGVVVVDSVGPVQGRDVLTSVADVIRAPILEGADALGHPAAARFAGLVLGDDSGQDDFDRHVFRASGLSHLLVVSGENVAFVLVTIGPLLRRLTFRLRWTTAVVALVVFGTAVRWEPSVIRAVVMASVALSARVLGRRCGALRALCLAVGGALVLDPLIVHSVGFQLSVAATAGIVLFAEPVTQRMPGPQWLRAAMGVGLAAHLGCAPLLVALFGVVPAAGLIVNLWAVPLAGWIMVWGLTAGWLAGVATTLELAGVATVVHFPTRQLVGAIGWSAEVGARPGLPQLDVAQVGLVMVLVGGWLLVRRRAPPWRRAGNATVAVGLTAVLAWGSLPPENLVADVGVGAIIKVKDGSTIVELDGRARGDRLADALTAARVITIDELRIRGSSKAVERTVVLLGRLWEIRHIERPGS
jgi:competence protein ComEC